MENENRDYVLIIRRGTGIQIGRKRYTKTELNERLKLLAEVGINHMEPMHIDKAFGPGEVV